MRTITILLAMWVCFRLQAQTSAQPNLPTKPSSTPYTVVSRTANSAVWQRTIYEPAPGGKYMPRTERYVELASGLNHLIAGKWVPSSDQIEISSDGTSASATNGQTQVYFPGNIYNGVIRLITPDGKTLESQPIGLAYSDGSNSVLLAVVTNATGAILSSGNQVIYTNAFAGLDADLLYTYTKAGFQQDVVLREQPPEPKVLGLNPAKTRLQIITEFVSSRAPRITTRSVPTAAGNLEDDTLSFGAMSMGQGKAFLVGNKTPSAIVEKHWLAFQGRHFLVEEVPIVSIARDIDSLPPFVAQAGVGTKPMICKNLILPPRRPIHSSSKAIFLAQVIPPDRGLVLDYQTLNGSLTNYTFQGDTTYYLSGPVGCYGTITFEGGAVIKYGGSGELGLPYPDYWNANCQATAYRPVIFTSMNDDSVGQKISGSTGTPSTYSGPALNTFSGFGLSNVRISYAQTAIELGDGSVSIYDGQFVNCGVAISGAMGVNLRNVLFANVGTAFSDTYQLDINAQDVTFSGIGTLCDAVQQFEEPSTCVLDNCILATVANYTAGTSNIFTFSGGTNGYYNCPTPYPTESIVDDNNPFQTVGGGGYYLADDSPFLNVGTTNINPTLLADLATKTTHPPIAYTNVTFTNALTFTPRAQRDTEVPGPDLGYHYDPLDYVFGGCTADSNLTFTVGTAAGWFRTTSGFRGYGQPPVGQGIFLENLVNVSFEGTEESPDYWVRLNTVQENDTSGGYGPGGITGGDNQYNENISLSPVVNLSFTRCTTMANDNNFFRDDWGYLIIQARNSEFYDGGISGYVNSCYLTNCFMHRMGGGQVQGWPGDEYVLQNCTWIGGTLTFNPNYNPIPLIVRDCTFEGTAFNISNYGTNIAYINYDYNAYTNGAPQLTNSGPHDVIVTNSFDWRAGPLGDYYLPSSSPLINAGDVPASQLGLYHFTVQTNMVLDGSVYQEVPEGTNIVSIGYHYVATDAYGNPLDKNGDGIPDYLEDPNGSGQAITISLLAPVNNAFFAEPATIPMQASVLDWSGIVTNVEFFNGSTALTALADAPYDYNWPIVAAGNYTVMAEAFDDKGATAFSTDAFVTVTNLCGD